MVGCLPACPSLKFENFQTSALLTFFLYLIDWACLHNQKHYACSKASCCSSRLVICNIRKANVFFLLLLVVVKQKPWHHSEVDMHEVSVIMGHVRACSSTSIGVPYMGQSLLSLLVEIVGIRNTRLPFIGCPI